MNGTLSGNGTILADQLGYRGGAGGVVSIQGKDQGESFGGIGAGYSVPNLGGGGCGGCPTAGGYSGGGGGYGSVSESGDAEGGNTYGDIDLERLFLGSGGGGGSATSTAISGWGGHGGSIILVMADKIGEAGNVWVGSITSNGGPGVVGGWPSGGG